MYIVQSSPWHSEYSAIVNQTQISSLSLISCVKCVCVVVPLNELHIQPVTSYTVNETYKSHWTSLSEYSNLSDRISVNESPWIFESQKVPSARVDTVPPPAVHTSPSVAPWLGSLFLVVQGAAPLPSLTGRWISDTFVKPRLFFLSFFISFSFRLFFFFFVNHSFRFTFFFTLMRRKRRYL